MKTGPVTSGAVVAVMRPGDVIGVVKAGPQAGQGDVRPHPYIRISHGQAFRADKSSGPVRVGCIDKGLGFRVVLGEKPGQMFAASTEGFLDKPCPGSAPPRAQVRGRIRFGLDLLSGFHIEAGIGDPTDLMGEIRQNPGTQQLTAELEGHLAAPDILAGRNHQLISDNL